MRKDWEYKKLGEVANVVMGQSPDGSNVNNENGMEFHQGKINFGEQFLMKSDCFTTQVTKVAEKGSILLCVRAPIGIINITDRDICIGRGLCAIKEKTEVDNLFLYYYLLNKKLYFEKNSTGSTFKAISSKVVLNTPIFLPPKPTQLAIVAELDKLNEMIRLKKQQLEDYDQLAQSIFYEMFGDPVENEKGWEMMKLGEICSKIGSGATPKGGNNSYIDFGISLIRSLNIHNNIFKYEDLAHIDETQAKALSNVIINKDDILLNITGASVARCCIVPDNVLPARVNQHVCIIRPIKENGNSFYLNRLLTSLSYQTKLMKLAKSKAATREALPKSIVVSLMVPLPPLPLQQQFAARIEAIEQQKQQVKDTIKDLETLLASRMQYWFD